MKLQIIKNVKGVCGWSLTAEKIQISKFLSLYGRLKDVFDINMGKRNEITDNKKRKNLYYILFPVISLFSPITKDYYITVRANPISCAVGLC